MDYARSSLDPLPIHIRNGMVAMGTSGLLSSISTLSLIGFITYRMLNWRRYYHRPMHSNQIFVLIYNLLLADLQQALSFLISFYWISQDKLVGPSPMCFAQGWLIQIGDVSSGIFVLAIGVHTFITLVGRRTIPFGQFVAAILGLWLFCLLLTILAPILHTKDVFVPAGAWCWIAEEYVQDRLFLHYLWIFISQLLSLVIYGYIFVYLWLQAKRLGIPQVSQSTAESWEQSEQGTFNGSQTTENPTPRKPTSSSVTATRRRLLRTARYMVVYPLAYVALSLPLAAGRVSAMTGRSPSITYYCVAGTMMAACGVIDVVLYLSTRRGIIKSEVGSKGPKSADVEMPSVQSVKQESAGADAKPDVGFASMAVLQGAEDQPPDVYPYHAYSSWPDSPGRTDSLKSLVTKDDRSDVRA